MKSRCRSVAAAFAVLALTSGACRPETVDGAESSTQPLGSGVDVLTSRGDVARTGANLSETILTTSNVKAGTFGKVYSRDLDGQVYAQPLYASGVGGKNVVYVATEHNTLYAFDADDTRANAAPIWQRNVGPAVPSDDVGCGLLSPEIGITGTPVIDRTTKTIWFVAKTKEPDGSLVHRLHALDIATGLPRPNSPVEITASVPGTGAGSQGGVVTMSPLRQMNRPGLLKVGSNIYVAFGAHCDRAPYHGWIVGYDGTSLQQTAVHNSTPTGDAGGVWHSGVGLTADEHGDIIYVSGNGTFDGTKNFGNSIVRLTPSASGLTVGSFFTPFDSAAANARDLDLGSTGGILLPGTHRLVTGDKRGFLYLVDKTSMGGLVDQDPHVLQRFQATTNAMHSGAAYYAKGAKGIYYVWGTGDRLKAFTFDGSTFDTTPQVNTDSLTGYPGGQVAVSANGEVGGSAILWTIRPNSTSPGLARSAGTGALVAFDALDVTRQLWSSDTVASDAVGTIAKFAPPTIANGRVFVGTASNQLAVYGLRGAPPPSP